MRREDNLMLCTIEELSNFIVENIYDFNSSIPKAEMTLMARFDFAVVDVYGNGDEYNLREIYQAALGWCGIDEIDTPFNQDRCGYIDLIAGHYGGGYREHISLCREDEDASRDIAKMITTVLEIEEFVDEDTLLIVETIPNY